MKGYDTVISVNPALSPAGSKNPEVAMGVIRQRVYSQGKALARKESGRMLRRVFGPASVSTSKSIALLVMRSVFGGWCLWHSYELFVAVGLSIAPVMFIIAGLLIINGVFTRITALSGSIVSAYVMCACLSEGNPFMLWALLWGTFSLVALTGPGRFSVDIILRRNIFRSICRRNMHRLLDNRFSYRAYEYAHYN